MSSVIQNDFNYIESKVGKLYTREDIEKEYEIDSNAYGALLCSRKDDGSMMLFQSISIEDSQEKYYYRGQL